MSQSRTKTNQGEQAEPGQSRSTENLAASAARIGGDRELTLDVIFQILKNSRRRRVLNYLRHNGGESTLSDLAEHVAGIENDIPPEQLSSDQRKRVYVGLYQCHLPKMDDAGVIDYNQSRGDIELTDLAEHFEEYLHDQDEDASSRPWYLYYAGIAASGFAALLGTAALVNSVVAAQFVSVGVVGLVLACSVAHWRATREDADE